MRTTLSMVLAVSLVVPLAGCGCGGDDGLLPAGQRPLTNPNPVRVGGNVLNQGGLANPKPGAGSAELGEVDPIGMPIEGVPMQIWKDGTQVGEITTNALGEYIFDDGNVAGGLLPSTAYEIRIFRCDETSPEDDPLFFLFPIPPNVGPDDMDSDGDPGLEECYIVAPIVTPAEGDDFTIDFVFQQLDIN